MSADHDVAIVLPPRENFSATGSGSVALLVHRLAAAPGRYNRIVVGAPCKEPFPHIDYRAVTVPRLAWGRRARRYALGVTRVLGPVRLIEVHNRAEVALNLARMRPDARVSLFLHNDPQTMRGMRRPTEREAATRRLAGIVCVSEHLASRVTDGTRSARATVLPNCLDISALPHPPAARENLILFAGRLVSDKGADAFVEACRQALPHLPGWRAEMIGADRFSTDSPITPFVARLTPEAARAGVTLSGYQPHEKVMAAMSRAAIVVVPSRWNEPFGLTALEAMAAGAALICSGRGGLINVVGDVALPCNPDEPSTIAAAIQTLVNNPTERTARGAAGWSRAGLFDLRLAAAALDAYRDGVVEKARPGALPLDPARVP